MLPRGGRLRDLQHRVRSRSDRHGRCRARRSPPISKKSAAASAPRSSPDRCWSSARWRYRSRSLPPEGLFVRAAISAAQADPGFSLDHQLMVSLDPSLAGFDRARTKEPVSRRCSSASVSIPGVERASFASIVPFGEFREGRTIRLSPGTMASAPTSSSWAPTTSPRSACRCCADASSPASEGDPGGDLAGVIPVVIDRILSKRLFADADPLGRQILIEAREGDRAEAASSSSALPGRCGTTSSTRSRRGTSS